MKPAYIGVFACVLINIWLGSGLQIETNSTYPVLHPYKTTHLEVNETKSTILLETL